MAPLRRIGSTSLAEQGGRRHKDSSVKSSLAVLARGKGGLTLSVKAIAKGRELSSVQYICLRDQGEQLALREAGEPAQVGSEPN